jgi:phosphate-selective porin OprO and OprP
MAKLAQLLAISVIFWGTTARAQAPAAPQPPKPPAANPAPAAAPAQPPAAAPAPAPAAPPPAAAPAPAPAPGPTPAAASAPPPAPGPTPNQATGFRLQASGTEQSPAPAPAPPPTAPKASVDSDLVPPGEKELLANRKANADGISFKPGDGVKITSADKDFSLGVGFRFQLLYTVLNEDKTVEPEPETTQSIQIRRARLLVGGNAFGEHNKYKLELAVAPRDVDMDKGIPMSPLLEAYAEFDHLKDLTIRAGQYKVPYDRIRMIADFGRQLVDTPPVTTEFTLDRDIGVEVKSNDLFGLGLLKYHLGIYSGKGRNSFSSPNLGLLYVGRVELLPLGLFEDYLESDHQRTKPRLALGAAAARLVGGLKDRGTQGNPPSDQVATGYGVTDFNMVTADAIFKVYGFSALAALYYRTGERFTTVDEATGQPLVAPSPSRDGTGFAIQAGYLVPRTGFEVAARYMSINGNSDAGHNGLKDSNELGGGLNYFFAQHNLKIQTDFMRLYSGDIGDGYNQFRIQGQLSI